VAEIFDIQKKLVPDLLDIMKQRYRILQYILLFGTVGRRTLAISLELTERTLRGEVKFLQDQGLLEIGIEGMKLTDLGLSLLEQLEPMIKEAFGLTELANQLCKSFGLRQVIIVKGDADQSLFTKKELGLAGADVIRKSINKDSVIAVTGGSTMSEVANSLSSATPLKECWFVPARGGLGERVELQANHIASTMAKRVGGQYRLLHIPDQLGEAVSQSLYQDPQIKEVVEVVRSAKIVIHGIGDAMSMALRRKVDVTTRELLVQQGALAEAFGYYFDKHGKVVHKTPTMGLRLEDLENMELVIGIAGGKSKGQSIAAVLKHGQEDILIIDEAAAQEILKYV
jgi:central glycolytic genes regulator